MSAKKFLSVLCAFSLTLTLLLSALPVGAQAAKTDSLKLLAIGNSYSMDSLNYLSTIAAAQGKDLEIGCLMLPSGSLSMHVTNTKPTSNGQLPGSYRWYTYKNGTWSLVKDQTLLHGLTAANWDVITLQQASVDSGSAATYGSNLDTLVKFVNTHKTNPNAKLLWHMTWSYDDAYESNDFTTRYGHDNVKMYQSIVSAVKQEIMPDVGAGKTFADVIPTGTAIQNARASGNDFNRDGTHLNSPGRIIASYTWYAKLFGLSKLDKLPVTAFPQSFDNNTGSYTVTAFMEPVIVSAVNKALADPFPANNVPASGSTSTVDCPSKNMKDVVADAWYHEGVDWVLANGVMSGYGENEFDPYGNLFRSQMVQVLYNKAGQPALNGKTHAFTDVPTKQWYNNAVTWASNLGVVGGYGNGKFGPSDSVTLEQVFVILWNYSGKPALNGNAYAIGAHSDWASNAIAWAQARGLLNGLQYTKATDPATRAQIAHIMMKLYQ